MENQTIKEILGLSSGTVAGLTGYKDYKRIDIIQVKLTQFTIGILASAPNEFSKWQEAWRRFEDVYNSQKPSKFAEWCENPKELKPVDDISQKETNMSANYEDTREKELEENPHRFTYMMLSRLQQDNKYFLGNGNGSERNLWALDVESQIKEMRRLWDILPEGEKPEWLTMDEITEFETEMYKKLALDESMDIVAETRAKIAETKAQNQNPTKETSSPSPKN